MGKWYELRLLEKLSKDAVAVNRWNRQTIKRFKRAGFVRSLGIDPKGPAKGKECVLFEKSGWEYWEALKKEQTESKRFRASLWMSLISAVIGAVLGFALGKIWP